MSVVASVFARFFYGSPDLVFSDIIAGFVLLGAVQNYEKSTMSMTITEIRENRITNSDGSTEVSDVVVNISSDAAPSEMSNLHQTSDDLLCDELVNLAYYSKYAIGIYGWMLYIWSHPWKGTFQLAFSCIKKKLPYLHGDNCFHLHQV